MIRRGFYLALRWAPVVLPLWLILMLGLRSWESVGVLALPLGGLALAAGLGVVLFLTWLRKDVRSSRAVSWLDVGVLGVWWVLILAAPFLEGTPVILFVLVVGIVAFWSALLQWVLETRRRVRSALDDFNVTVQSAEQQLRSTRVSPPGQSSPSAPLRGHVIRIDPPRGQTED